MLTKTDQGGSFSGVATGLTGVDVSTPVFPVVDFPILKNPLRKVSGGGEVNVF